MKRIFKRTSAFLLVVALGALIFLVLLFAGDKSKGPLQDLFSSVDNGVAKFEKKMAGGNIRETRSNSLKWFDRYRNNKVLMNYPDTIFLGVYDNNTAESY